MHTIRAALARFFCDKKGIDIISNERFIQANAIFTGLQKINKKKGLGCARFAEIWLKYFEFQILWSLSSVDFHTLTL